MTGLTPGEGSFSDTPFARLLFELWSEPRTGRLTASTPAASRALHLENGDVVVEREGFEESAFLETLAKKRVLAADQVRRIERQARTEKTSALRAAGELGFLSAYPMWNLLESFYARRLFPLFDAAEGGWTFTAEERPAPRDRWGLLAAPELVRQGIRAMQNESLWVRFLPEPSAPIQVGAPACLHKIAWEPYERYALHLLGCVPDMKSFLGLCEFGRRDAYKVLFAFFCLGVLRPAESRSKTRPVGSDAPAIAGRALEALNEKCAFVYKFITKEIGPLGRTIVARVLEELKPGLGPRFQNLILLPDGRIEADAPVAHNAGRLPEELTKALIKGYEEILVAEVLAVRKSLGARHETALVQALEKFGCP
jgi:hypothetical protein